MNLRGFLGTAVCLVAGLSLVVAAAPASAGPRPAPGVQLENLDRGLVAASTSAGDFLSWRLLGQEVTDAGPKGMTGPDFVVFRDGKALTTVTDSTNYLDPAGTPTSVYQVAPTGKGPKKKGPKKDINAYAKVISRGVTPWADGHYDLPLMKPAAGVTPAGEAYTYSANDMSVGDADGDGSYEFTVKWDPSNSKDVSQIGYTGPVFVDTYEADGTLLYRLDLGVNIRAGAHYTQFLVYDFDGDGRSEMMVKTAPGSKVLTYDAAGKVKSEKYVTMPAGDVAAGYSNADDYRLSKAGYYQHVVKMFMTWQDQPEVVAGHWPATLEQAFGQLPTHTYPLSRAAAEELTDYFMDVYAPSRSARNVLRNFEGFIVDGPEYLTVFKGATGAELQTIHYEPGRHDDGLMWGDYAMARIEPANRVDRFLAAVAYLDGKRPSAVFARGYYTRTNLVSYNWDGKRLSKVWKVDSGWTPMSNPFNDSPHGVDGTDPQYGKITTQGFHSLSVADVDGDGKQEIVYGSATINEDGSVLYSSFDTLPPGSANPGASARLGHGDAMHVTDIDPDHPGLEIFTVHEGSAAAPYGMALRDAATGKVLFGQYSGKDTGRGMIGDVRPDIRGIETWAGNPDGSDPLGLRSANGTRLSGATPGTNFSVRWAADGTTQIINGSGTVSPTIDDWTRGRLATLDGTLTNNGTKGTPSLVADVIGDWREEVMVRTTDSSAIRFFVSTEVTDRKMYTLMHDPQYRVEVARQQTTYNQPSYPGFYLASDTVWADVPVPTIKITVADE